ncbi:MAG: hypothetical protein GQ574_00055 [Crocinitomix sp.]|nr:hypothetical protein [Crocinitomix sp.]
MKSISIITIDQTRVLSRSKEGNNKAIIKELNKKLDENKNVDIVCLPEAFSVKNVRVNDVSELAEEINGPTITQFSEIAKKHRTYIICPLYLSTGTDYVNAAVLINRNGEVIYEYHKQFPWPDDENFNSFELGVKKGETAPIVTCDFGTIGIFICSDVYQFNTVFEKNATPLNLIFWVTAFHGGQLINSIAQQHKTFVVTSNRQGGSRIIDPLGKTIGETERMESSLCKSINCDYAFISIDLLPMPLDELVNKLEEHFTVNLIEKERLLYVESQSNVEVIPTLTALNILTLKEIKLLLKK